MKQYYHCSIAMTGDIDVTKERTEKQGWEFSWGRSSEGEPIMYATKKIDIKTGRDKIKATLKRVSQSISSSKTTILVRKAELVFFEEKIKA